MVKYEYLEQILGPKMVEPRQSDLSPIGALEPSVANLGRRRHSAKEGRNEP